MMSKSRVSVRWMRIASILSFIVAAIAALLTAAAAISFGNEYGYRETLGNVAFFGAILIAIPVTVGIWLNRRSR
jgi:hypothetical protein